jgi:hypothetical protein
VELELPETGVCSGPVAGGGGVASGCCGPTIAPPATSLGLISLTPLGAAANVLSLAPTGARSALLTLAPLAEAPAACCAADVQVSCCEPAAKAGCCGAEPAAATSCGCQ